MWKGQGSSASITKNREGAFISHFLPSLSQTIPSKLNCNHIKKKQKYPTSGELVHFLAKKIYCARQTSATVLRIPSTTCSKSTRLKSGCCLRRCSCAAKVSSWFFKMEPAGQEGTVTGRQKTTRTGKVSPDLGVGLLRTSWWCWNLSTYSLLATHCNQACFGGHTMSSERGFADGVH